MHWFRIITTATVFTAVAIYSTKLLGTFNLDDMMSQDEQQKTGVNQLSDDQKRELETWMSDKFILRTKQTTQVIYLEQNRNNGAELVMSDGSIYEVYPADRPKATFWMTPVSVTIEESGDPYYPFKITNNLTNVNVKAKQLRSMR